jgi:hypothetical protein
MSDLMVAADGTLSSESFLDAIQGQDMMSAASIAAHDMQRFKDKNPAAYFCAVWGLGLCMITVGKTEQALALLEELEAARAKGQLEFWGVGGEQKVRKLKVMILQSQTPGLMHSDMIGKAQAKQAQMSAALNESGGNMSPANVVERAEVLLGTVDGCAKAESMLLAIEPSTLSMKGRFDYYQALTEAVGKQGRVSEALVYARVSYALAPRLIQSARSLALMLAQMNLVRLLLISGAQDEAFFLFNDVLCTARKTRKDTDGMVADLRRLLDIAELRRFAGRHRLCGILWMISKELGCALTDAEKAMLKEERIDRTAAMCSHCKAWKVKISSCSGCSTSKYCDAKCQKEGWPEHKKLCHLLRKVK